MTEDLRLREYTTERGGPGEIPAGTSGRLMFEVCHDKALRISDRIGYLCTTTDGPFILELLAAERFAFPYPDRPHYYAGARELISPGFAAQREKEQIAFWAALRKASSKPTATITLEDLGL